MLVAVVRRFLHNHANIATEGSPKSGLYHKPIPYSYRMTTSIFYSALQALNRLSRFLNSLGHCLHYAEHHKYLNRPGFEHLNRPGFEHSTSRVLVHNRQKDPTQTHPENTRLLNNDGLMLCQRRKRWPNIDSSFI